MSTEKKIYVKEIPIVDTIDIIVEGGVVQNIIGIPKGVEVRVVDYDIEGTPDSELSNSPHHPFDKCILSTYEA